VFAAGIAIAIARALDRAQMLWALLPVALLILIVAGAFGIGYRPGVGCSRSTRWYSARGSWDC